MDFFVGGLFGPEGEMAPVYTNHSQMHFDQLRECLVDYYETIQLEIPDVSTVTHFQYNTVTSQSVTPALQFLECIRLSMAGDEFYQPI